jgi:hypothetical protein
MNVDDYLYVYSAIIKAAAEMAPTTDRNVVYALSSKDKHFYEIVQKVGEDRMGYQLRQLFIELVDNGVFNGMTTKQSNIINAVTPLGYSIIEASKKPTTWQKIKKAAPKWAADSLTSFLIAYLTR